MLELFFYSCPRSMKQGLTRSYFTGCRFDDTDQGVCLTIWLKCESASIGIEPIISYDMLL